jgi:hypothetical protein
MLPTLGAESQKVSPCHSEALDLLEIISSDLEDVVATIVSPSSRGSGISRESKNSLADLSVTWE